MKTFAFFTTMLLLITSCSTSKKTVDGSHKGKMKQELVDDNTFLIAQYSKDTTYGYTEKNPIKVGGNTNGPKNEQRFLNTLAGPNGEKVAYYRIGSCCYYETPNSPWGKGVLDMYSVTYEGLGKSVTLYINMYESDVLEIPVGFKVMKRPK